jgi:hypothetical protein
MGTKYTYSISTDFPHHVVDPSRLTQEVRESAIAAALDYINTSGDDCDIWFKAALSSGDEDILDGLVAVHSGEALPDVEPPKTSDGKPIVLPCLFPPGVFMYYAGCADDPTNGRGQGEQFHLSSDTAGDETLEFTFNDWVYLTGGDGQGCCAELGDWITFEVVAPASTVTPNGGGTGNCNLVDVPNTGGTLHVIVPAAGNGTHDLDQPVPIPAGKPNEKTGYWEWDWPDEGKGTVSAGEPGKAEFNLYDFQITLNRQLPKYQLLGDRTFELTIPAVNPGALLPYWKQKITLHNGGHTGLKVVWTIVCARYKTV